MKTFTVVYDVCVLYPDLRNLLMQIALQDIFSARWTDTIHDEWIENLLGEEAASEGKIWKRTRNPDEFSMFGIL